MQDEQHDDSFPICPSPATRHRLGDLRQEGNGLVRACDVRGVLHCHSAYSGGAHRLRAMVETARDIGLEYLGISDHARSDLHADGLDARALAHQREEIEALRGEYPDFDILQGVEVYMERDGAMPLDDEALAAVDYVIVSLANGHDDAPAQRTALIIRAIMHPYTTVLSKPLTRFMTARPPVPLDLDAVLKAAAETRTAVEITAIPDNVDAEWRHCRRAQELGVLLSINPNAHRAARLVDYRHGVELTRKAGLCCRQILNTLTAAELRGYLRRDI